MGLCAVPLHSLLSQFGESLGLAAKLNQIQSVLLSIVCAIGIYVALAFILRCTELKDVLDALRKKRSKTEGPSAANEEV